MIQCPKCGTRNDDKSKFCLNCGNSLNASNMSDFQNVNNQSYAPRGQNDSRRIDENRHVNAQQQSYEARGQNDPRRIDENSHVSKQQQKNTQQVNNLPQANSQQQSANQSSNNSGGSILDKLSGLSMPIKILGFIVCCCVGILIVSSLMGGVSDQGSLASTSSYGDNSYDNVFDTFNKADCKEINYNTWNNNPNRYNGENIKLQGRVMQVSEGHNDGNYLLLYVDDDYNQLAYVEYYQNMNIDEGDWITVYGVSDGSYTYPTANGGTYTVPSVYGAILE